jgi:N-methylhydantoinase A
MLASPADNRGLKATGPRCAICILLRGISICNDHALRFSVKRHSQPIAATIGERLALPVELAATGISEMVDENMSNAARVHAIESGKDVRTRTLIALGGAAPLHAARVAEKLGIDRLLIPANAGVGSAVALLRAPAHSH